MGQSFKHEITNSLSSSLSDKQTDLIDKSEYSHYSSILNDRGQRHDLVSRSQLYKEQHNDPEILPLLERAFDEKETDRPRLFLCQKWHFNEKIAFSQIVDPDILNLAHDIPMSGHFGINKLSQNSFYLPGLKSDISQFCKSCYTCQMVGKPNQTITKQPIPAFDEPFSRIIIAEPSQAMSIFSQ